MAQKFPKIPKVREHAEIELALGSGMTGYMFVEAASRMPDVVDDNKACFAHANE